jgi:hypothetical protein
VGGADAEAEDVRDLGVDGVLAMGGAGDDRLDAAADEADNPGATAAAAGSGAGCYLRDLSISGPLKHAFRAVSFQPGPTPKRQRIKPNWIYQSLKYCVRTSIR